MKKCFPLILFLFTIIFPSTALASEVEWQFTWKDDHKILEQVSIIGHDISIDEKQWSYSRSGEKIVLEREVENWQEYNDLADRLPLKASVKNYLLFKNISLTVDDKLSSSVGLYAQLSELGAADLLIKAPGFIDAGSAKEISNLTATWNFSQISEIVKGDKVLLRATVLEGFSIGLLLFFLGFLTVMLVFFNHVRKVNKLIEDEYSLDMIIDEEKKANNE